MKFSKILVRTPLGGEIFFFKREKEAGRERQTDRQTSM